MIQKYASVEQLINLPLLRPLNSTQSLFKESQSEFEDQAIISEELNRFRKKLLEQLKKQARIFNDENYSFKFPPSIFPNEQNTLKFQQRVFRQQQDIFGQKLNSQQLEQIRQTGEFLVRSSNPKAPNVWKINDCFVRGRKMRAEIWKNGLAWCYRFFCNSITFFIQTIPSSLEVIGGLPKRIFEILFGLKSIRKLYEPPYEREIAKDFWSDIMQNQLKTRVNEIGYPFLDQLYIKYQPQIYQYQHLLNEKGDSNMNTVVRQQKYQSNLQRIEKFKASLILIENKFNQNWKITGKRIYERYENMLQNEKKINSQNFEKIKEQLEANYQEQKFSIYLTHVRQEMSAQRYNLNIIQALAILIVIVYRIQSKIKNKQLRLNKITQSIYQQISQKYPIRENDTTFKYEKFEEMYEKQRSKYEVEFYEQFINDPIFKNLLTTIYVNIFRKYEKIRKFYPNLLEQKKKLLKCLYGPTRVFQSGYSLLPPYEVIETKFQTRTNYSLKKEQRMSVDTSTYFWKTKLYCMRLTTWTINWVVTWIGLSWIGPFGLRCLCGIEHFTYDEQIMYDTGAKTYKYRDTVLGTFRNVLQSIERSRNDFQSQPDLGLLGKNFSRLCNYFECYIGRFLFIGIIGVLILYPITIILFSVLCFFFVLTFWFWVPLAMIICYLFNILIFEFQYSQRQAGCIIRGIPLLSLALRLTWSILKVLFALLLLFVFAPLICAIFVVYLAIQRLFRTFTDCIMICIIGCCGRTPSRDTYIATKISGANFAGNYYYSINENDVYLLVQSSLQKTFVNKFITLTRSKIQFQQLRHRKNINYILKPISDTQFYPNDAVIKRANKLLTNFNKSADTFLKRYPNNPTNVRFTQQQLNRYFANSIKLVKNYVEQNRIKDWIFEEKEIQYGNYQDLTHKIWMEIFNCGQEIFQPLEQLDARVALKSNINSNSLLMNAHMQQIMRITKGGVPTNQYFMAVNPLQQLLHEQNIQVIQTISTLHDQNSKSSIIFDGNNPCFLMIPHRNIEELKNYDKIADKRNLEDRRARGPLIQDY